MPLLSQAGACGGRTIIRGGTSRNRCCWIDEDDNGGQFNRGPPPSKLGESCI
jgi:hypothetical protein